MSIENRLAKLRKGNNQTPLESAAVGLDIVTRIQRLRPVSVTGQSDLRTELGDSDVARLVEGRVLEPGVILIERKVDLTERHGRVALNLLRKVPLHTLPETLGHDPEQLLFLDTETTGLAGGTGTLAFLFGFARIIGDRLVCRQYLLTRFSGEESMLRVIPEWLGGISALVSFNGKSFDLPLMTARYRLMGLSDPFEALSHIDLLHPVRRTFSRQWDDCRLGTVETNLLGFRRQNDLPGSDAPRVWLNLIQHGDARLLPAVTQHNLWDLLSMVVLLPMLIEAHNRPADLGADVLSVARVHRRQGDDETALRLLSQYQSLLDDQGLLELARLLRRQNRWDEACLIWEQLAQQVNLEALVRLAKYYEHVRRDYETALDYASLLPVSREHDHRRQRLEQKMSRIREHRIGVIHLE